MKNKIKTPCKINKKTGVITIIIPNTVKSPTISVCRQYGAVVEKINNCKITPNNYEM